MFPKLNPKIKKFVSEYYGLLIIPVLIWYYIQSIEKKADIEKNSSSTYAMVYNILAINKTYSKRNYLYEFKINGIKQTGSSPAYNSHDIHIGNWYKIEFSANNPEHNSINFEIEYYPYLIIDGSGKVTDTVFLLEDAFNKNELNLRIKRVKSLIDSMSE